MDPSIGAARSSLFVLGDKRGRPYTVSRLARAWTLAREAAGVLDVHFHDLRAKAATDAKALGLDHQALLGHKSRAMSDKYVKLRGTLVSPTLPRRIVEKL
jgi:integrase